MKRIRLIIIFTVNLLNHSFAQNDFGISFNAGGAIPYGVFSKMDAAASVYYNPNSTFLDFKGFLKSKSGFALTGNSFGVGFYKTFKKVFHLSFDYQRSKNILDPSRINNWLANWSKNQIYTAELANIVTHSFNISTLCIFKFEKFMVLAGPVLYLSRIDFPSITYYVYLDSTKKAYATITDFESRNLHSLGFGLRLTSHYYFTKHLFAGISIFNQSNNFSYTAIYRGTGGNPGDPIDDVVKTRIFHVGINVGYLF